MSSSLGCLRCEYLPPKVVGPGTLKLRFPLTHSLSKLIDYLTDGGWEFSRQDDILDVRISAEDLTGFAAPLMSKLSSTEQNDIRALFQRDGQLLGINDYFEIDSLNTFIAKAQSGWLIDMMESGNLTSVFQPIVNCQDDTQIFGYECLLRGQDGGQTVFPNRILDVARGAGLLFQLDRAARLSAIRQAARFNLQGAVFINFTPTSIYDPTNCLRTTVKAVDELGFKREQVVFEVIESELVHDVDQLKHILNFYREQGFHVALDDIGSGYSSLNLLTQLRPDFIKLDRELILDVLEDDFKATVTRKLIEAARELNVKTVAEGVEDEATYEWLREAGTDYAQGYYWARPASPPPTLKSVAMMA